MESTISEVRPHPFVKWVGGKGQLIHTLEEHLPIGLFDNGNVVYVEPFIGGGSFLFNLLWTYHDKIVVAFINDMNSSLIGLYRAVKENPMELVLHVNSLKERFNSMGSDEERKEYYLSIRKIYNESRIGGISNFSDMERAAMFLFLNKTCFNGLYRENRGGEFNVPFGKYKSVTVYETDNLLSCSHWLNECNTEIMYGDFEKTLKGVKGEDCSKVFYYMDPPYRGISKTSSFNSYNKELFGDEEQLRLKRFCDELDGMGIRFMLSNSDGGDGYFEELYKGYRIERVEARRSVNRDGSKRGKVSELVIMNY